jgi:hypothetical protein
MAVKRYDAPVPVRGRTGRTPSKLTRELTAAVEDIRDNGVAQRYDAASQDEAEKVSVRVRQIASKLSVPLSVAVVVIDGNDAVIFGPREGTGKVGKPSPKPKREPLSEIKAQLTEILDRLDHAELSTT